jgi:hypothetical protein
VADAALPAETYVGALAKVCRALLAPRVLAVSCMASAHLKERIQLLMKYDTLRKSAFSHRFTATASALAVLLTVAAAGVVTANPIVSKDQYRLDYALSRTQNGMLDIRTRVVDTKTNEVIGEPTVTAKPGEHAVMHIGRGYDEWRIFVRTNADSSGMMTLVVMLDGREMQNTTTNFPAPGVADTPKYTGERISLQLKQADLRDVIRTFGEMTGLEITIAPDVKGSVTVDFKDVPWDQALELLMRQNGLSYRLTGNKMEVFKP